MVKEGEMAVVLQEVAGINSPINPHKTKSHPESTRDGFLLCYGK